MKNLSKLILFLLSSPLAFNIYTMHTRFFSKIDIQGRRVVKATTSYKNENTKEAYYVCEYWTQMHSDLWDYKKTMQTRNNTIVLISNLSVHCALPFNPYSNSFYPFIMHQTQQATNIKAQQRKAILHKPILYGDSFFSSHYFVAPQQTSTPKKSPIPSVYHPNFPPIR